MKIVKCDVQTCCIFAGCTVKNINIGEVHCVTDPLCYRSAVLSIHCVIDPLVFDSLCYRSTVLSIRVLLTDLNINVDATSVLYDFSITLK